MLLNHLEKGLLKPIRRTNYRVTLDSQLRSLRKPYCIDMCCDVHCCDQTHIDEIDTFLVRMLESITMLLNSCIPMTDSASGKKISRVANWNEDVLPYKDTVWFSGIAFGNQLVVRSIRNFIAK